MPQPFSKICSPAVPLGGAGIDSGRIFPSRFLKKARGDGYERFLFHDERFDADGRPRADCVFNLPVYRDAGVLVAGADFGCGSSREAAVHALWDAGFRCVIASSFGEIFFANCLRNGLLAVVLADHLVDELLRQLRAEPGARVTVDFALEQVVFPDGAAHRFRIDARRKQQMMRGDSERDAALRLLRRIRQFEADYHQRFPWLRIDERAKPSND